MPAYPTPLKAVSKANTVPAINQFRWGQKCRRKSRVSAPRRFGVTDEGSDVVLIARLRIQQLVGVEDEVTHFGIVHGALGG